MNTYFENLIIRLTACLYIFTRFKFRVNQILFNIQSINLIFMHNFKLKNLKLKYLIDNIIIDL